MSQRNRIVVGVVTLFVAIGSGYTAFRWLASSFGPPDETTEVGAYTSTLKQWSSSGLTRHFPAVLPPQATNVRFAAFPGYLQGGAYIQVRMHLPGSEIRAIEDQLKRATTHVYVGGGFWDHYEADRKNNWPTTQFRTSDDRKTILDFPSHYTLYALSARDRALGSWNHGETSGAAVSATTNEVVYWADQW